MKEADWLHCSDPQLMLRCLRFHAKVSERKLRLFAIACCRRFWHLLTEEGRGAIDSGEQYADGLIDMGTLQEASSKVGAVTWDLRNDNDGRESAAFAVLSS